MRGRRMCCRVLASMGGATFREEWPARAATSSADPDGRPAAVRVFPGNTGDPVAFTQIVQVLRDKFGLATLVMVGDRGMITSARLVACRNPVLAADRARKREDLLAATEKPGHRRPRPAPHALLAG
jgi:hypothetical protein